MPAASTLRQARPGSFGDWTGQRSGDYLAAQSKYSLSRTILPTLTATTTAVFSSVGLSASTIYNVFVGLVGSAVDFGLWLCQVSWPYLLVLGFIYLVWKLAHKFLGFGR